MDEIKRPRPHKKLSAWWKWLETEAQQFIRYLLIRQQSFCFHCIKWTYSCCTFYSHSSHLWRVKCARLCRGFSMGFSPGGNPLVIVERRRTCVNVVKQVAFHSRSWPESWWTGPPRKSQPELRSSRKRQSRRGCTPCQKAIGRFFRAGSEIEAHQHRITRRVDFLSINGATVDQLKYFH